MVKSNMTLKNYVDEKDSKEIILEQIECLDNSLSSIKKFIKTNNKCDDIAKKKFIEMHLYDFKFHSDILKYAVNKMIMEVN